MNSQQVTPSSAAHSLLYRRGRADLCSAMVTNGFLCVLSVHGYKWCCMRGVSSLLVLDEQCLKPSRNEKVLHEVCSHVRVCVTLKGMNHNSCLIGSLLI